MNPEEIYRKWKEKKTDITPPPDFTNQIMMHIKKLEQKKAKQLFDTFRLLRWLTSHPLAKVGLIATGAIIGFIRFLLTIRVVLG